MVTTIYKARSPDDISRFQRDYGDLTHDDLHASASNARPAHLPHHRLILGNQTSDPDILPAFADDHAAACPRCHPDRSPQRLHSARIDHATREDVSIKSLLQKSSAELDSMPCSEFWVALVACILPAHPPMTKSYDLRPKSSAQPSNAAYVPSSSQTGSSSPPPPPPSSPYSADDELDEDAFANLRAVPESSVSHLAYMTDRYALYCLCQDDAKAEFRARLDSVRYTAQIGLATITACDDGGVALFDRQPKTWSVHDPSVTNRETKIASAQVTYDPDTNEIKPVITDEVLAQCLLEAVTAMRADPVHPRHCLVLELYCSVFCCLLQFRARARFHAFQDAKSPAERQALAATYPEDTCIEVTSTRWLCLLKPADRGSRFCNMYSSLRMYVRDHSPNNIEADNADNADNPSDHNNSNDDGHSTTSQTLPALSATTTAKAELKAEVKVKAKPKPKGNRKRRRESDAAYAP